MTPAARAVRCVTPWPPGSYLSRATFRGVAEDAPKTQQTQPQGIDPGTGKPYEPVEIPIPKEREVEGALDRLIDAAPD